MRCGRGMMEEGGEDVQTNSQRQTKAERGIEREGGKRRVGIRDYLAVQQH
jgi:hypothetical protein